MLHQELRLRNIITITTITIRLITPTAMTMGIPTTATAGVEGFSAAALEVNTMNMASMAGLATASAVVDPMEVDFMAAGVDFTVEAEASMVEVADFMEVVEAADTDNSL